MSSTLTDLTAATTWSGTDLFYALVGGNSRKIAAANFLVGEAADVLSAVRSTNPQTFRVYRTFTDSSNYERLAFTSAAGEMQIRAETAGTGTDDLFIRLVPSGSAGVFSDGGFRTASNGGTYGGLGYYTGAGVSVTQLTSKSTTVVTNKMCARIDTHNEALAAGASVTFTVTCNVVLDTDCIIINVGDQGTPSSYRVEAFSIQNATQFQIRLTNISGGSLSQSVRLQYVIIKGANS